MSALTKQIDDTTLEYYWLTKKDLEKIKKEEEIDIDSLYKALKIKEFMYYQWIDVSVDDILPLINKAKSVNEKVFNNN